MHMLDEAIDSALIRGRGGKGALVVFSSGNQGGQVEYPANSNPNILSVGAIYRSGARRVDSNYGASLDLVAPGDSIFSTMLRSDPAYVSGTFMAASFVSGVAALVISRNPLLTGDEIRAILKKKAKKIGGELYVYEKKAGDSNGTWNQELGYGLVDAYAAVDAACSTTDILYQTITTNKTISDCVINASDITVNPNAKLRFEYCDGVYVVGSFDVRRGAQFEIK